MNSYNPIIIEKPEEEFSCRYRFWQGCPTVVRTSGGRIWAGWYSGGTKEPAPRHYNILIKSDDNGFSWSNEQLIIDSDVQNKVRAIDIQLWIDPNNRMWLFWVTRDDKFKFSDPRHLSTWAMISDIPDAEELNWSNPRRISQGFLRCKPTVLTDGRYFLCAYDWTDDNYGYSESYDNGETWQRRKGGKKLKTDFDETMVLEKKDGFLWMLARSKEKVLSESFSSNGGKTWSDGEKSRITAPPSRFFIDRLPSGRILLVYNNDPQKRCNMTVSLSEDDGNTWKYSLVIDQGNYGEISYPDVAWDSNGTCYIVYDHGRSSFKEILLSCITEKDIIAGKLVSNSSFLKNIISKAPGSPYNKKAYEHALEKEKIYAEYLKSPK